jgi:anti-anti-sigma factor
VTIGLGIDDHGDTLVLHGEFDMAQTAVFEAAIAPWVDGRRTTDLVLDLADVSFVDSSAIRSFLQLAKALAPRRLQLCRPQPMVGKVLDLTALAECPNIDVT